MLRRRKPDDRVILLFSSIATFSANLVATHVSRRRTLLKKYGFLKSLIHLYYMSSPAGCRTAWMVTREEAIHFCKEQESASRMGQSTPQMTPQQWSNVIWSDENKFMLFGSDDITWIRRPKDKRFDSKYQLPIIKYGGGLVMIWGAFSAKGMSSLYRIDGIMDRKVYINILKNVMLSFAKHLHGCGFIYQQDNDPKHRAT